MTVQGDSVMQTIDFENSLNQEQLNAVRAPDGPALVLAAAGTGKTRTLIYRVAHCMNLGTDSHRILLLTFTNRAAREMLDFMDTVWRLDVDPDVGERGDDRSPTGNR